MLRSTPLISKLGSATIAHYGGDNDLHERIGSFLETMDEKSGRLFDMPARINIYVAAKDHEVGKNAYACAADVVYKGMDKPSGWEVRQINDEEAVYYVPRHDGYILVSKKDETLDVKLFMDVDYRIFTVALLELIQLATTRPVVHATTINYGSEGVLVDGTSGKGKTTLLLQLITAHAPIKLISEDRSIIENGTGAYVSTLAQIRKDAGKYIGLSLDSDRYVEMSGYIPSKNVSEKISAVVHSTFNLEGKYKIAGIMQNGFKPLHRDWFVQVMLDEEIDRIRESKLKGIWQLPDRGYEFHYSVNPEMTSKTFMSLTRC